MADRARNPDRGEALNRWAAPPTPMARLTLGLVRAYQRFLSPVMPPSCRFYPTCSEYTAQALLKHGALRGAWLGLRRITRCHPFNKGGYDPVP